MQKRRFIPIISVFTILLTMAACRTSQQRHLVEPLFLQPGKINISHPAGQGSNATGARILSEQVTYTLPPEEEQESGNNRQAERLDTSKVYTIPQVTVVSKARFAPLREGNVNIDFVIRVPKEFLSEEYQLCLTPRLLHNDSLVMLKDVVLRGSHFIEMQKEDYRRYNEYLATIIDPQGYDTAFVDRKAIEEELTKRRKNEIINYYDRWRAVQEYEKWRIRQQEKYDNYNVKHTGNFLRRISRHDREYKKTLARMLALEQDTTQVARKYRKKREKMMKKAHVHRQITLATVPAKYQEIYQSGISTKDIEPLMPQEKDSMDIASEHIMHELIAFNEIKGSRREEIFNRIVPSPYQPEAHHNAQILPDREFVYRYTSKYPVTPGLKNLRLTLESKITATDRSHYNIRKSDTLTYLISSLDELADASILVTKELTEEQRKEYTRGLQLLRNRQYQQAINILNQYKDYNTALALTCLGYDQRAYNLLIQLPQNANTNYLAAILSCRLGEENRAIEQLKKAIRMDEDKQYRVEKDPEISRLIKRYGLRKELEAIAATAD